MRGDMGGAATVCATTLALARLKVPINVVTVVPLTENMPGPSATKPGDMWVALSFRFRQLLTENVVCTR